MYMLYIPSVIENKSTVPGRKNEAERGMDRTTKVSLSDWSRVVCVWGSSRLVRNFGLYTFATTVQCSEVSIFYKVY